MVISVDTGNKMIKTEHYEFNSGIDVLDTIPGENDEVIEFGGKYYRTTNRRISYMEDKTEDDRYYILTLIAIAKELDTMKKEAVLAPNELIEIELLVGLPPAHYGKYRKNSSSSAMLYFWRIAARILPYRHITPLSRESTCSFSNLPYRRII